MKVIPFESFSCQMLSQMINGGEMAESVCSAEQTETREVAEVCASAHSLPRKRRRVSPTFLG